MKRNALLALLLALTLLMLLPVTGSVNVLLSDHATAGSLMASGSPGPAPTPSVDADKVLIASGSPGPAPVPGGAVAI